MRSSKDEVILDSGGPHPRTGVLRRRGCSDIDTETQEDATGRPAGRGAKISRARTPAKLQGREGGPKPSLPHSLWEQVCRHLDFGLWVSRTEREYILVASRHPVPGSWFWQPRECAPAPGCQALIMLPSMVTPGATRSPPCHRKLRTVGVPVL